MAKRAVPRLTVPRAVLFFVGDQLPPTIPPPIRALQDPEWQLQLLQDRFPDHHFFFVVFPARLHNGFASFDQFLHHTTQFGEPAMGYASTPVVALRELFDILDATPEWVTAREGLQQEVGGVDAAACPAVTEDLLSGRYIEVGVFSHVELVGFSKGCVVLNQIFAEMSALAASQSSSPSPSRCASLNGSLNASREASPKSPESPPPQVDSVSQHHSAKPSDELHDAAPTPSRAAAQHSPRPAVQHTTPAAGIDDAESRMLSDDLRLVERAHREIRALHFLDGGLNTRGAYVCNPRMINAFSRLTGSIRARLPHFFVTCVTTCRQCEDPLRPWVKEELQKFLHFLKTANPTSIPVREHRVPKQLLRDSNPLEGLELHMSSQMFLDPSPPEFDAESTA